MRFLRPRSPFLSLLLIVIFVVGVTVACGGSSEPAPTSAPDNTPTQPPAATDTPDVEPDPTAPPATMDTSGRGWNVLGSPDALVTVIDYSDFQ